MIKLKLKPTEVVFYRLYFAGSNRIYGDFYVEEMRLFESGKLHTKLITLMNELLALEEEEVIHDISFHWLEWTGHLKNLSIKVDIKKIIQKHQNEII